MRNSLKWMSLLLPLTLGLTAFAHEDHDHGAEAQSTKGTVESFADGKLVLKATDGKKIDVMVDEKTAYENAGAKGSAADLKAGLKVVVQGAPMKDGTIHATNLQYGKKGTAGGRRNTRR